MTVKELIKQLNQYNPNLEVCIGIKTNKDLESPKYLAFNIEDIYSTRVNIPNKDVVISLLQGNEF